MHLTAPVELRKGDRRKVVYYTIQLRELLAAGWELADKGSDQQKVAEPAFPVEKAPVIDLSKSELADFEEDYEDEATSTKESASAEAKQEEAVDFSGMTKAQLVKYAESNNIDVSGFSTKTAILEAILSNG
jgi:hypothetical protein